VLTALIIAVRRLTPFLNCCSPCIHFAAHQHIAGVFHNSEHYMRYTLKSLSSTWWSCRADSTKTLNENNRAIRDTLATASDCDEKTQTKLEAAALLTKLDKLEMVIMTMLWDRVLHRFKATSDQLQRSNIDLATALGLLQSLHSYVGTLWEQFAELEESARTVSATQNYQYDTRRVRKREKFAVGLPQTIILIVD